MIPPPELDDPPPVDLRLPADLPTDPNLTYNPRHSAFLGAYPSSFPTRREGLGSESNEAGAVAESSHPDEPSSPIEYLRWEQDLLSDGGGTAADGDLELLRSLAQGGFGDVWLGQQRSLRRTVAIKRLRKDQLVGATPEQQRAMRLLFQQEALTTARLEHPNIVPVYQLLEDQRGNPLLSMKWVKGRSWDDLLKDEMDRPVAELMSRHLPILIDVAQAVAFAHSQGILHRDLKPHQVMVGEFGEVLLMDWGLAMPFGAAEAGATEAAPEPSGEADFSSATLPGPAGTPSFMAPEQAHGDIAKIGPWTDLYLLGGMLYFLLTGTPPHKAPTSMAALLMAARGDVPPPHERVGDRHLPQELVDLAMSALAAEPQERRPGSVTEFIAALQEYLSGASRRQRSRALLQEVIEESLATDYLGLEQQLSRLRQARVLWPENPRVDAHEGEILAAYVELALSQRDLTLAQVQAEQLADDGRRQQLLTRIAQARTLRQREARQRQGARLALAAMLLILVVGGFKYAWDQRQANERLVIQRDAARQARAESEGLMSFMLEDLWDRLSEIGRVDVLASVSSRAEAYYAGRELEGLSPEETFTLGVAMVNLAQVLATTGELGRSIETEQRAAEIFAGLLVDKSLAKEARHRLLESRSSLAVRRRDLGQIDLAEPALRKVLDDLRAAVIEEPESTFLRTLEAQTLDGLGILLYDSGRMEPAKTQFERAEQRLHELIALDPSEDYGAYRADVEFRLGVTLIELGQMERALELIDGSRSFLVDQLQEDPLRSDLEVQIAFFDSVAIHVLQRLGRLQEGHRRWQEAQPVAYRLLADDPQNAEVRYTAVLVDLEGGRIEQARGELAEAEVAWRRGAATIEAIMPTDHGYLLDTLVRLYLHLGELEKAQPLAEALLAKGWEHRDFLAFCRRFGLEVGG